MWILQAHSDLRRAIDEQPTTEYGTWGGWNWPEADIWKVEDGYSPLFDMPFNSEIITYPLLAPEIQGVAEVLVELGASCHPFPRVQKGYIEECTPTIIFSSMETPKVAKFSIWSATPMTLGTEANELWHLDPNSAHWPTRHLVLEALWVTSSRGDHYPSGIDNLLGLYLWDE